RLRDAGQRRHPLRWPGGQRRVAAQAGPRHRLPVVRAVPHDDGGGEHRVWLAHRALARREDPRAGRRDARADRPARPRSSLRQPALGWPAAARGVGPSAGPPAGCPAARRAPLGASREADARGWRRQRQRQSTRRSRRGRHVPRPVRARRGGCPRAGDVARCLPCGRRGARPQAAGDGRLQPRRLRRPGRTVTLDGRTALVTGAARGIGLAITERLLRDGCRVALLDRDAEVEAVTKRFGAGTLALVADVTRTEDVERSVQRVVATWGRLDVVVDNAGITGRSYPDLGAD